MGTLKFGCPDAEKLCQAYLKSRIDAHDKQRSRIDHFRHSAKNWRSLQEESKITICGVYENKIQAIAVQRPNGR